MRRGFTLIELSIALLIIAVVLAGGLVILTSGVQQAQYNATVATMDTIEKALLDYSVAFSRLPCPSDLALTPASANYGVEAANPGSCAGGTPAATYTGSGVAEGGIPTRSLQLPDSFMYDAWGRRLRYAVDPSYTNKTGANASLPPPIGGVCPVSTNPITIKDINGANRSTAGIYAIVSHGANGHGGYTSNGSATNAGSTNADELTNCHCNSSAASTGYSPTYVQEIVNTASTTDKTKAYDDIVAFKELWQMRTGSTPAVSPACLFVADSVGNFVARYVTNTQTWTTLTNGFNHPNRPYIDGSGYLWLSDYSNNEIWKSADGGNTWAVFVSGLSHPYDVFADSSGNVYVLNNTAVPPNIQEYNSSATLINTLTDSFSSPYGMCHDSSGNIWVADSGHNVIKKYNGAAWTTIGSLGTAPGKFNDPTDVYVDVGGNLWVTDYNNNRVQKCAANSDCTVTTNWTAYGAYPPPNVGTDAGQFKNPDGVTGDAVGNIWVVDTNNLRIQKFTAAAGTWSIVANYRTNYGQNRLGFFFPIGIAVSR